MAQVRFHNGRVLFDKPEAEEHKVAMAETCCCEPPLTCCWTNPDEPFLEMRSTGDIQNYSHAGDDLLPCTDLDNSPTLDDQVYTLASGTAGSIATGCVQMDNFYADPVIKTIRGYWWYSNPIWNRLQKNNSPAMPSLDCPLNDNEWYALHLQALVYQDPLQAPDICWIVMHVGLACPTRGSCWWGFFGPQQLSVEQPSGTWCTSVSGKVTAFIERTKSSNATFGGDVSPCDGCQWRSRFDETADPGWTVGFPGTV